MGSDKIAIYAYFGIQPAFEWNPGDNRPHSFCSQIKFLKIFIINGRSSKEARQTRKARK